MINLISTDTFEGFLGLSRLALRLEDTLFEVVEALL